MLNWISIKNLALIEKAEIEFGKGLNVITGETGAGKTVLMSAISLILGDRADKSIIRNGADSCEICANLTPGKKLLHQISKLLSDAGIPVDEELNLKRVITQSSSKNYINDSPASLQLQKQLGEILIDTHGPHEHQSLLKPSIQLDILDSYALIEDDLLNCRKLYHEYREAEEKLLNFERSKPSEAEIDFLKTMIKDIEKTAPQKDEDEEISKRHKIAADSHNLIISTITCSKILDENEGSINDRISEIFRKLRDIEKVDPDNAKIFLSSCTELKNNANSLADSLRKYAEKIELDEKEFTHLEDRLSSIQTLKRRYGPTLDNVLQKYEDAKKQCGMMENQDKTKKELTDKLLSSKKELGKQCEIISEKRKFASAKFAKEVISELKSLGFQKSLFHVDFLKVEPGANGSDKIEFMFSANPGEKEKPLREIASSGEISRVMLALKTVLASADSIPILVFDEIDVNIGGLTASAVGEKLKNLGKTHQILCITHLPQVASSGDIHLKVDKEIRNKRTFTTIRTLKKEERVIEISRMLGGTEAALKHAVELLKNSGSKRIREQ